MHCQEEWPILDTIKVHAIEATREIERAHERSLVGEQSAVDEIRGCTVLWQKSNWVAGRDVERKDTYLRGGSTLQRAAVTNPHDTGTYAGAGRVPPDLKKL